jgi:hypothetical protein
MTGLYIIIDDEFDDPRLGIHSMLAFASVAVSADGTFLVIRTVRWESEMCLFGHSRRISVRYMTRSKHYEKNGAAI